MRFLVLLALLAACRQDMHDQPRFEPLEHTTFFTDGRSARPQVAGTVARGELRLDEHLYTGKVSGKPAETFPFAITKADMERGQQRFNIFCANCHGRDGYGRGMVVERGMKPAASFHDERLRKAAPGYFFDVVTNGFGAMFDLSYAISVEDRWRVIAYVRALQRSQNAALADAPPERRAELEKERQGK